MKSTSTAWKHARRPDGRDVPIPHRLYPAHAGHRRRGRPRNVRSSRNTITGVPTTSLLNPERKSALCRHFGAEHAGSGDGHYLGAYALDTMQLGRKFDLIGGVRWDRFDTDYSQTVAPASAFSRVDRDAELARSLGLQAEAKWQHLLRRRQFFQSFGGDAFAERRQREYAAGEEPDV